MQTTACLALAMVQSSLYSCWSPSLQRKPLKPASSMMMKVRMYTAQTPHQASCGHYILYEPAAAALVMFCIPTIYNV